MAIYGLKYQQNFVPEELKERIETYLSNVSFEMEGPSGRKVLQFGREYSYTNRDLGKQLDNPPDLIQELRNLLPQAEKFTQIIINRYLPGEEI